MLSEDEKKLYYIICDISKICRKYFFARKNLPSECMPIDDAVKKIADSTKKLKNEYKEIKNKDR